jgi:hypothetical protein
MRATYLFATAFCIALAGSAAAQVVDLANGGSLASINAGPNGLSGLTDWRVANGDNQVVQQAYAYRVGNGLVNVVNTISAPAISQPTADLATIGYTSAADAYDISFRYLLTGSASSSDLAEVVTLTNNGQSTLTYTLFEYDLFTLGGLPGGTATLQNTSTIHQSRAGIEVTVGATRIPDRYMISDSTSVVLSIFNGQLTNTQPSFSGNDVAFAFQWDVTLAAGQSWQMSKNKILAVPEPTTLLALASIVASAALRRRKRG